MYGHRFLYIRVRFLPVTTHTLCARIIRRGKKKKRISSFAIGNSSYFHGITSAHQSLMGRQAAPLWLTNVYSLPHQAVVIVWLTTPSSSKFLSFLSVAIAILLGRTFHHCSPASPSYLNRNNLRSTSAKRGQTDGCGWSEMLVHITCVDQCAK
jgi:hypothetical protein